MAKKKKICKHCGAPMVKTMKICPECGGKNPVPFFSRWYVWVIILLLLSGFWKFLTAEPDVADRNYMSVTVDEMYAELEDNALSAEEKYNGEYVSVTGRMDVIDSDGQYIGLYPLDDEWALHDIHCTLTSDEQKEKIMEHSKGDTITVKGKITDVGELLGYYMDVDSIE